MVIAARDLSQRTPLDASGHPDVGLVDMGVRAHGATSRPGRQVRSARLPNRVPRFDPLC
jgi:hypothetical protein